MESVKEIEYYDAGKTEIKLERWKLDGKLHREDGPAYIRYHENGKIELEYYYIKRDDSS